MKQYTSLVAVAAVAVSGCVNYKSFNAGESPQPGATAPSAGGTRAGQAKPSPTPAVQTSTKAGQQTKKQPPSGSSNQTSAGTVSTSTPTTGGGAAQANQGSSSSSSTSSAAASTPKPPAPAPQVIKEETTSKVEVISSRPVVGTDAQMGN